MKAFLCPLVTTPFGVDNVTTRSIGNVITGSIKLVVRLVWYDIWVPRRIRVVVALVAKGSGLKVIPCKLLGRIVDKVGLGNPIDELFCVIKVRTPLNVPPARKWCTG